MYSMCKYVDFYSTVENNHKYQFIKYDYKKIQTHR